jgi:hypothetical protein
MTDQIETTTEDEEAKETAVSPTAEPDDTPEAVSAEPVVTIRQEAPASPSPTRPDPTFERRAIRRGCFSVIFGAVLGALVGAALTLSVLAWLNSGSLAYNQPSVQLGNQLDDEIATRQMVMDTLIEQQAEAEATLAHTVNEVEASMATTEAGVADMQVTAVYLETRISQAGNAADRLDTFLFGLDDLISDVEPSGIETETPTASPTARATATPTP